MREERFRVVDQGVKIALSNCFFINQPEKSPGYAGVTVEV